VGGGLLLFQEQEKFCIRQIWTGSSGLQLMFKQKSFE